MSAQRAFFAIVGLAVIGWSAYSIYQNPLTNRWLFGVVLVLALTGVVWALLRKQKAASSKTGPNVLEGVNLVVYTVVGIAIVVLVNWFVNNHDHHWDLTPNKQYSLSPQTLKLLKGLDRDVTFYVFDRKENLGESRDLLGNYASASRRVTVRYIDPVREPSITRQYGVTTAGTVVVAAGDRHYEAQSQSEEGVTNALVRVLTPEKTVYFVQGHGERDPGNSGPGGYSAIKKALSNENYQTKTLNLLEKPVIPADCSLLVIAGPQKNYFPQEVEAVSQYLNGGGRALIMFDARVDPRADDPANLAKLLNDWNVTVHDDLVIEPRIRVLGAGPGLTVVLKYGSSPIVQPLAEANVDTVFPLARSFAIEKVSKAGLTDVSLCETSADSYGVADFNPKVQNVAFSPGTDFKGPLSVAVSGILTPTESHEANEKKPEGRFVALGTSALASNDYLDAEGNRDLVMNAINWLSAEEDLISIRPKPPEFQHLNLTVQQLNKIFYLGVIGLPLAIIVVGTTVWWRRR